MKQNRWIKYSLMVIFLFLGLLFVENTVEARGITCNYTFNFTYDKSGIKFWEGYKKVDSSADFQLIFQRVDDKRSGALEYDLVVTGNHSIKALNDRLKSAETGGTLISLTHNDKKTCPKVYLYQKKRVNKSYNKDSFNFLDSIEGENIVNGCKNKSIYGDYWCDNIIGPISGTLAITSCSNDVKNEITSKLDSEYKSIENLSSQYLTEITNKKISTSTSSKEEAEKVCNQKKEAESKTNELMGAFKNKNFEKIISEYVESNKCTLSDKDRDQIVNKYEESLKSSNHDIIKQAQKNDNECINNSNVSDEEKQNLKNQNEDEYNNLISEQENKIEDIFASYKNYIDGIDLGEDIKEIDCHGLLGDDLLDLISEIFNYVKIAAPIILIVLGSVDFVQAVMSDDKDALKKAFTKFIKRAIVCVAIFFIPTILNWLLTAVDGMGKDPLCGIK